MSGRPPVRGKKRSSSAPPQRPGDAGSSSDPPDQPVAGGEPAILEGDLMELPAGKSYDSCNENDGPTGDVLEEEELVGVEEHCTSAAEQPRTGSPTRASTVATNSKEKTKQLTAAQQAHAADQVKWQYRPWSACGDIMLTKRTRTHDASDHTQLEDVGQGERHREGHEAHMGGRREGGGRVLGRSA